MLALNLGVVRGVVYWIKFWIRIWVIVGMVAVGLTRAQTSSTPACNSEFCQLIASGNLSDLRWPDFSDYSRPINNYYERDGYQLSWFPSGAPTPQTLAMIEVLREAGSKGLEPEDYDGSRWAERLAALIQNDSNKSQSGLARLDLALTVAVMRYASDVHFGKSNPGLFHRFDPLQEEFDLPEVVRRIAHGIDGAALLAGLEPPFRGYQETQKALLTYIALAHEASAGAIQIIIPTTNKPVEPGSAYASTAQLAQILRRLGDLPRDASILENRYEGALVEAVKHFQARHGLDVDGRIGKDTIRELDTPLDHRVTQLQLALERWRWLPTRLTGRQSS